MKQINVFPDHSSSGFWDSETGIMIDEDSLIVPDHLLIAYKYWCHIWEFVIAVRPTVNYDYIQKWHHDGLILIREMNNCQQNYEFIVGWIDYLEPDQDIA